MRTCTRVGTAKMAADAAALLDQLMGSHRDAVPGENIKETQWWDPEVCKHYLCGFCPCELFTNTRSDVGTCHKLHDDKLKKAYEESERKGKMGYEDEFLDSLERLVKDLDRKISRGKERLRKSASAKQEGGPTSEKLTHLSTEINNTVTELEQLGAQGRVEEAQNLMRKVEGLEKERERERLAISDSVPRTLAGFEVDANDFHEKMELCDVCGSFLVIGDTQSRVDAHLLGKQHMGYSRIRGAITELKKSREERWKIREEERKSRREGAISKEREQGRKQSRSRSRSRERYRRRSVRSRSRSRERDKRGSRRSRSRSRERDRRSRSKERNRRSRSRSRERSRRGSRRSRSRERERRSRSRERDRRSRSRERDRRSRSRGRGRRSRSRGRGRRSHSRERERRGSRRSRSRSKGRGRRSRSKDRKQHDQLREHSPAKENGAKDNTKDKEKKSLKEVEEGEVD